MTMLGFHFWSLLAGLFNNEKWNGYCWVRCVTDIFSLGEFNFLSCVNSLPYRTQSFRKRYAKGLDMSLTRFNNTLGRSKIAAFLLVQVLFSISNTGVAFAGGAYSYRLPLKDLSFHTKAETVVGSPMKHRVQEKETLLDIATEYGLGFNELADLYPQLDPWLSPEGMELVIPSQWILPDTKEEGIVINIAELRLYYFLKGIRMIKTCPIGIGDQGWHTPLGIFRIGSKRIRPTWFVPPSLQAKYGVKTVPAGPDNPLGDYYMALDGTDYGIHGTNFPWAVGRLVTHGCIRLYPEDIEQLFNLVPVGTPVEIIYEPVKFGFSSGRIYVEVHQDIYHKIDNFMEYGWQRLMEKDLARMVDPDKFQEAIRRKDGLPVDVTFSGHKQ
jgi:L,D-transpeptidase ErfK/SrfK